MTDFNTAMNTLYKQYPQGLGKGSTTALVRAVYGEFGFENGKIKCSVLESMKSALERMPKSIRSPIQEEWLRRITKAMNWKRC